MRWLSEDLKHLQPIQVMSHSLTFWSILRRPSLTQLIVTLPLLSSNIWTDGIMQSKSLYLPRSICLACLIFPWKTAGIISFLSTEKAQHVGTFWGRGHARGCTHTLIRHRKSVRIQIWQEEKQKTWGNSGGVGAVTSTMAAAHSCNGVCVLLF